LTFAIVKIVLEKKSKDENNSEIYGAVYGALTTVLSISLSSIATGTCNPAQLLGGGLVLFQINMKVLLIVLGQLLGGLVGAILWDEVFNTEKTDGHQKHIDIAKQKEEEDKLKAETSTPWKEILENENEKQ